MHCTCQTVEDVFKVVRDKEVSFIQIWFSDILGVMKSFSIRPSELEEAMTEGMGFDASSIEGFARIQESDMIAKPDPTTFQILPWRPDERPVARMFCDILQPDGSPYPGDPRYALKRVLAKAAEKGYTSYLGPELEFFYFADSTGTEVLDDRRLFRLPAPGYGQRPAAPHHLRPGATGRAGGVQPPRSGRLPARNRHAL